MAVRIKANSNSGKYLTMLISGVLILTLFSIPLGQGHARAQTNYSFISEPGKIPYLSDWETPVIEPGDSGSLIFSITNRYFEQGLSSNNLTDVSLTLGVYRYATLDESEYVNKQFDDPPKISKIRSVVCADVDINLQVKGIITVEPGTNITLYRLLWDKIPVNHTCKIELQITTNSRTPEGTYFIKSELIFRHSGIENKSFVMRSLGYYSKSEWDHAKNTAPEGFSPSINLTVLDIDGVIPETSFSIKRPLPAYPTFIFIGLAVFFAILTGVFYYMEEHNKFPGLKKKLDGLTKKR